MTGAPSPLPVTAPPVEKALVRWAEPVNGEKSSTMKPSQLKSFVEAATSIKFQPPAATLADLQLLQLLPPALMRRPPKLRSRMMKRRSLKQVEVLHQPFSKLIKQRNTF